MASTGVSSGVFTGSDFRLSVTSPKPAVQILSVPTSKAVNNTSYYDGVTKKTFSDIVQKSLPSSQTVDKVKTGLSLTSKTPKITPAHLLVGAIAGGALYGLNQLYPDDALDSAAVSSPKPAVSSVPSAFAPSDKTAPQTVNDKTVQIINNFSPEILGKLKVESDTDLISALVNASVAQNQSAIMGYSILNTQLGMLNEQFFGFLAYLDLFLQTMWDQNELITLNTASNYDTASEANAVNDTVAESVLRIGDKLSPFAENQEWLKTASPVPSPDSVATPLEAQYMQNYNHGKGEADTNSIGTDTIDFLDDLLDDMDITPSMLKGYLRIDSILDQARKVAEGDNDTWQQLMEELYA